MTAVQRLRIVRGLVGALVLFAILEAFTRAELVDPTYLPPASTWLTTAAGLLVDTTFLGQVLGTIQAWAIGLLLATAIAIPVGVVMGSSRRSYLASITTVEFLRPIPSVALIPVAILLLGRGVEMKVALIAFAATWPILFNTIYGMHEVDPVAKDTARVFGYSRLAVLWRVALPSAAPFIYTGIRIASAIALILAVSTELIAGGSDGLGTWMLGYSQTGADRRFIFAGIVFAGLIGLAINALMVAGERRLFFWHPRVRGTS